MMCGNFELGLVFAAFVRMDFEVGLGIWDVGRIATLWVFWSCCGCGMVLDCQAVEVM